MAGDPFLPPPAWSPHGSEPPPPISIRRLPWRRCALVCCCPGFPFLLSVGCLLLLFGEPWRWAGGPCRFPRERGGGGRSPGMGRPVEPSWLCCGGSPACPLLPRRRERLALSWGGALADAVRGALPLPLRLPWAGDALLCLHQSRNGLQRHLAHRSAAGPRPPRHPHILSRGAPWQGRCTGGG